MDYKGVVIDAGHGGSDGGASGNGILEKEYNLNISQIYKLILYINNFTLKFIIFQRHKGTTTKPLFNIISIMIFNSLYFKILKFWGLIVTNILFLRD